MPQIKSAKRAVRAAQRRAVMNKKIREAYKEAVRLVRQKKEQLAKAQSFLDRAAKKSVIHTKKAARLKSRLSKLTHNP